MVPSQNVTKNMSTIFWSVGGDFQNSSPAGYLDPTLHALTGQRLPAATQKMVDMQRSLKMENTWETETTINYINNTWEVKTITRLLNSLSYFFLVKTTFLNTEPSCLFFSPSFLSHQFRTHRWFLFQGTKWWIPRALAALSALRTSRRNSASCASRVSSREPRLHSSGAPSNQS